MSKSCIDTIDTQRRGSMSSVDNSKDAPQGNQGSRRNRRASIDSMHDESKDVDDSEGRRMGAREGLMPITQDGI